MNLFTRTDVINYLINSRGYKSYLEIGVDMPENNFNLISCERKISVDPYPQFGDQLPENVARVLTHRLPSDDYFMISTENFDIIFIDGLHEEFQVQKDILNSYLHLNEGGIIVIHDCLPICELDQLYPIRVDGSWNGTTWRALVEIGNQVGLNYRTIDLDNGIGLIEFDPNFNGEWLFIPNPCELTYHQVFGDLDIRNKIMRVISPKDFLRLYK